MRCGEAGGDEVGDGIRRRVGRQALDGAQDLPQLDARHPDEPRTQLVACVGREAVEVAGEGRLDPCAVVRAAELAISVSDGVASS